MKDRKVLRVERRRRASARDEERESAVEVGFYTQPMDAVERSRERGRVWEDDEVHEMCPILDEHFEFGKNCGTDATSMSSGSITTRLR